MIRIANAPVSYGLFELARPDLVELPSGEDLARWVAEAGYQGIDMGPVGLLGTGDDLVDRLRRHNLELAGGWVDLPFSASDEEFAASLSTLDEALAVFDAAAAAGPALNPLPTLADSGSADRKSHPGGGAGLSLAGEDWTRFVAHLNTAVARVRDHGLEPTFHHHACTFIETPDEIDALLNDTDVDLTFDSGHLMIGGGDPVAGFERWQSRINHVHLKDVRPAVLREALTAENPMQAVWMNRAFVALGEGELDIDGFVSRVIESGFSGWLVVEQDVIPASQADVKRAVADQKANRELLRKWF